MTVNLGTGRFRTFTADVGVPVAITVSLPRWPLPYKLDHRVRRLAPFGLMDLDGQAFEQRYLERLESLDLRALVEHFEAIAAAEGGRRLVLLCWEPAGQPCHRRSSARFFEQQTGQAVPELDPGHLAKTLTLFDRP
jgi:hypothetical protein